jgi:hypothetical protein
MKLKTYMGFVVNEGREGAVLVFAHTAREALKLARPYLEDWFQCDFIDARATIIRDSEYLYEEANQEKLGAGIAHVIDSPTTCNNCELWGVSRLCDNKYCEDCCEENCEHDDNGDCVPEKGGGE